jgi:hypothetical protein
MIICSKHEGNGTYREFMLDDAELSDRVPVKTHLAHKAGEITVSDDDWRDAGLITRARDGLEALVLKPSRRGSRSSDFVKLDRVFPNEIAALQAIAVHYEAAPPLKN